jgi:hypothetical protein
MQCRYTGDNCLTAVRDREQTCDAILRGAPIGGCDPPHPASNAAAMQQVTTSRLGPEILILESSKFEWLGLTAALRATVSNRSFPALPRSGRAGEHHDGGTLTANPWKPSLPFSLGKSRICFVAMPPLGQRQKPMVLPKRPVFEYGIIMWLPYIHD